MIVLLGNTLLSRRRGAPSIEHLYSIFTSDLCNLFPFVVNLEVLYLLECSFHGASQRG